MCAEGDSIVELKVIVLQKVLVCGKFVTGEGECMENGAVLGVNVASVKQLP